MNQAKTLSIKKENIIVLAQFSGLMAIALIAPLLQYQAITGTMVNAVLFISVIALGVKAGLLIGLIPSLIALSFGLLPIVLAPMVPFIVVANMILVLAFNYLRKNNYWFAVVSASFLKFIFLFGIVSVLAGLFLKETTALKAAAVMMGWPQFLTALAGGLIAYLFLKAIKKI